MKISGREKTPEKILPQSKWESGPNISPWIFKTYIIDQLYKRHRDLKAQKDTAEKRLNMNRPISRKK